MSLARRRRFANGNENRGRGGISLHFQPVQGRELEERFEKEKKEGAVAGSHPSTLARWSWEGIRCDYRRCGFRCLAEYPAVEPHDFFFLSPWTPSLSHTHTRTLSLFFFLFFKIRSSMVLRQSCQVPVDPQQIAASADRDIFKGPGSWYLRYIIPMCYMPIREGLRAR